MAAPTSRYLPYETIVDKRRVANPSVDFLRLRWTFASSLSQSIHVLRDALDQNSLQDPYVDGTHTHEISSSSIAVPPVSSITVSVYDLDHYPDDWVEVHMNDAKASDNGRYDANGRLEYCDDCEEGRPDPGPSITITNSDFVTIGQYIDEVFSWLSQLEHQIRLAKGVQSSTPLRTEVGMWVDTTIPSPLFILDERGMSWVIGQRRSAAKMATELQSAQSEQEHK